eukprot:COSAG06_NODE_1721_length_8590_cov_8.511954_4_plen_77_part_00
MTGGVFTARAPRSAPLAVNQVAWLLVVALALAARPIRSDLTARFRGCILAAPDVGGASFPIPTAAANCCSSRHLPD